MRTQAPQTSRFVRDRLLGVFDSLLAQSVLLGTALVGPLVLGFALGLEPGVIALVVLLVCQIALLALLVSVRRALVTDRVEHEPLVRAAGTDTILLVDRFGLPRPVSDRNTLLYLAEILGCQADDLPEVPHDTLKPVGPPVKSLRDWSPPRTVESAMSFEASRSLKFLRRTTRKDDGSTILSFHIRYDSPYPIQINSAKLVFVEGSPVPEADISPAHSPITLGLPQCTLLFNGESQARVLSSQQQCLLELAILRDLSPEECERITTIKLGYIAFSGEFRDTQVVFHKEV